MRRLNLLHAHGSPTRYLYMRGCRCDVCRSGAVAYQRRLYRASVDTRREYDREYRKTHPEVGAAAVVRNARWYKENHEHCVAYKRRYREKHREEIQAQERARYQDPRVSNRQRVKAHLRRVAGESFSPSDVRAQHKRQRGRCYYCGEEVGSAYHIDHVIPLALGGTNDPGNIVIACPRCNLQKSSHHPMDFAGRMF